MDTRTKEIKDVEDLTKEEKKSGDWVPLPPDITDAEMKKLNELKSSEERKQYIKNLTRDKDSKRAKEKESIGPTKYENELKRRRDRKKMANKSKKQNRSK